MNQNYVSKLLLAGAIFVSGSLYAQKTEVEKQAAVKKIMQDRRISDLQLSEERETPSFIQFDRKTPLPRYQTKYQLTQYLALKEGIDELRDSKITHNRNEVDIQEYKQYFKGLPVEFATYRALMQNENTFLVTGSYFDIPTSFNTQPSLTERQALNFALTRVGATKYAWQQVQEMIGRVSGVAAKQTLQKELNEYLPQGQLVIVKDFSKQGVAEMHLAYKYNIYAAEPLSRDWIYVDAQTGKILLRNPIIHHASVPTTVTTRYAGNRVIYTKQVSGNDPNSGLTLVASNPAEVYVPGSPTYILFDDTRGGSIQTYDLNGVGGAPVSLPGVYAQAKSFTDVNNIWTPAEHKRGGGEGGAQEAENDDIAFDAHWGAEQVYDYWLKKHERLSYDGKNAAIRSFIHYGPAYDNAFWNGSVMTYGDGSGNSLTGFKALTSLDVCGHEIGHGVCSNTSDLVYEKESGAMNEGLSDIWAACIENFAIDSVDGTLGNTYKPFFIGEQIGFGAPLRYMDNPKAASNPDTYNGQYWTNVNCTPTLANDECGVHNNSGVLNKWFYLLTCGSGAGSGPDAALVRPGADDQMKDNGTVFNSIPYSVNGIGFELSEDITYLTEQLLTSAATYAEARSVSIAVATALKGNPCDPLVQSVTNAWFAVGVGDVFATPCNVTYGFVQQAPVTISEGSATGVGCNSVRNIIVPILTPIGSITTVTLGGTATLGDDYTVNTTSFSNSGSSTKTDSIVVAVKNDAIVEGPETIVLMLSVTGTTAVNSSYTINVSDNDVVPTIGSDSVTLINPAGIGAFNGTNGFGNPAGFTEVMEIPEGTFNAVNNTTPNGKNQWAINNNQLVITGKTFGPPATETALLGGTYNPASASQTRIAVNTPLDARGLSNLRIAFDYTVQGEVDPATAVVKDNNEIEYTTIFDYMALAYSLDGVNYTELSNDSFPRFGSPALATGRFVRTLPNFLNNQLFYLAFRWNNDANAGGPFSVTLDNLSVKGLPKKIETTLNSSISEFLVTSNNAYFYSQQDGDIIARINKGDATNYGCVTATVEKAGNTAFTLYTEGGTTANKVGDKVIRLSPAVSSTSGANTVSIYFTEQEIAGIESGTMVSRNSMFMYKTEASNFAGATAANTTKTPATFTAIVSNGTPVGGFFTATFGTGFSAFAVGAPSAVILPVTCTQFTASQKDGLVNLQWKVTTEVNNKYFEVERSIDGVNFNVIASVMANALNNGNYTTADNKTTGLTNAYYRIRQYDVDGRSTYVCQTVNVRFGKTGSISIGGLYPNPVNNNAFVKINTDKALHLQADFINIAGQTIRKSTHNITVGDNTLQVLKTKLPAGTYLLRFTDNETGAVIKTQTFVQQ